MLEHQKLRILPWGRLPCSLAGGAPQQMIDANRRIIISDNENTCLGFIRKAPADRPRWLRWFLPESRLLRVHESDDDSLLLTLSERKGLFPVRRRVAWAVLDAEGHTLGTVACYRGRGPSDRVGTTVARDQAGQAVVAIEGWSAGFDLPLRILQPGAPPSLTELGTLCSGAAGMRVEFAPILAGQPLAKMLVLAAVLASGER
jgi:hypothetical protein